MELNMQLGSRSHDIILKSGCLANLYQFANVANRKVFILTDSGVPEQYAPVSYTHLDLGTYTGLTMVDDLQGENQDIMKNTYIGRRAYYTDKTALESETYDVLVFALEVIHHRQAGVGAQSQTGRCV